MYVEKMFSFRLLKSTMYNIISLANYNKNIHCGHFARSFCKEPFQNIGVRPKDNIV